MLISSLLLFVLFLYYVVKSLFSELNTSLVSFALTDLLLCLIHIPCIIYDLLFIIHTYPLYYDSQFVSLLKLMVCEKKKRKNSCLYICARPENSTKCC